MARGEAVPTHKLTTILMADVVGYSSLMAADREGTVAQLKANRKELIIPKQEEYKGRTVKLMGDGALMEFGSVVDAVNFAVDVQRANKKRNEDVPQDRRISYRIGITIGDIIIDDQDIYGDGINISARLESICEPDCVYLTEDAYRHAENGVEVEFEALGKKNLKNIPAPVSVYKVLLGTSGLDATNGKGKKSLTSIYLAVLTIVFLTSVIAVAIFFNRQPLESTGESIANETSAPQTQKVAVAPQDNVSIAVLPFENMSGDHEQEYFSDGISEDIIVDLSQISSLNVIARNSSFAYKGTTKTIKDIANELKVGFVLDGSVRKIGDRVRISTQLINTNNGHSLWADRYDRKSIDIFELQDEIRNEIVSALSIQLIGEESKNISLRSTNSFEAYDLFLKGRRSYNEFTLEGFENAESTYRQAIKLDPGFSRAYGALGITLTRQLQIDPDVEDRKSRLDEALSLVNTGANIESTSPQLQWALGYVHMIRGEYSLAAEAVENAVSLSPNYADGWGLLAFINNQMGRSDQSLRFINKAMKLNPGYTWDYPYNVGFAFYNLGEYQKAIEPLLLALERNENAWNPRIYLAASYVRLGLLDDAEWEITQLEMINPSLSLSRLGELMPLAEGDHRDRLFEDIKAAGLSE